MKQNIPGQDIPEQAGSAQHGLRVLVVDDSPDIRALIEIVIRRHSQGWQVVGAADCGERAVEQARAEQPDIVLLDISMPGMSGLEALPLVHEAAPAAVLVMLTGFANEEARAGAEAAGAQGYLVKDNLVRTLIPRIEAVLAERRAHLATGEPPSVPGQRHGP